MCQLRMLTPHCQCSQILQVPLETETKVCQDPLQVSPGKHRESINSTRPSSMYSQGRSSRVSAHADTKSALSNIHTFIRKCITKNHNSNVDYTDYHGAGHIDSMGSELMDNEENARRQSLVVRLRQNFGRRQSWSNKWKYLKDSLTSCLQYYVDPYGENFMNIIL